MGKLDELKVNRGCPCVIERMSRRGEVVKSAPSVLCDYDCGRCGWNPEEVQRRELTGRYKYEMKTHNRTKDDGTIVHSITNRVKTLHFRSAR